MDEGTESLLLRRALGRAHPEDYVSWGIDQLCRGADGPNLRILAGLSTRFDRDEVEGYFRLSCGELGVGDVASLKSPLETARMIRRAYDRGRVLPRETVEMMADVYESSDYREELLAPWHRMLEEMTWGDGYFYPPATLVPLDQAVRREWSLLDRALALTLPHGWLRQVRCTDCRHVGQIRVKQPSRAAVVLATLRRRPSWSRAVCERCSSSNITSLADPSARSHYLEQIEHRAS